MSTIEVNVSAPKNWDEIATAIDSAEISITEALYIARAILEISITQMDRDVQRVVWLAFERALAEKCPGILADPT